MKFHATVAVKPQAWKAEVKVVYLQNEAVMVVARTRIEGSWAAFVDAAPRVSFTFDTEHVLDHGTKMTEGVARGLFPEFHDRPYAR